MADVQAPRPAPESAQRTLLYHFCRLRLPHLAVPAAAFEKHLDRSLDLYRTRRRREGQPATWADFLDNLHPGDWFVSCACLERSRAAWEHLFAMRASRADC